MLGQAGLGFKLSIPQILVPIAICGTADIVVRRKLVWPASGILAGNSVALLLRAAGTRHTDWWTVHGLQWFVLAALIASASKYVLRVGGRHIFNPSNIGLVVVFSVGGITNVFPQYLWWGPPGWAYVLAMIVVAVGGFIVLRQLHMLSMAASFLMTFWASIAILAVTGHGFFARWSETRIAGFAYWKHICLSPEVLVFALLMMSDPQTAPRTRRGRVVFGAAVAGIADVLIDLQRTEFGVKLAILASLAIVCVAMAIVRERSRVKRVLVLALAIVLTTFSMRAALDRTNDRVERAGSSGIADQ